MDVLFVEWTFKDNNWYLGLLITAKKRGKRGKYIAPYQSTNRIVLPAWRASKNTIERNLVITETPALLYCMLRGSHRLNRSRVFTQ